MALDKENLIVAFGRNRSGMFSGELDYSIYCNLLEELNTEDTKELIRLMTTVRRKCYDKLYEEGAATPLSYKISRIISFRDIIRPFYRKGYVMWPITCSISTYMSSNHMITTHGWQIGWKDNNRIYGWTLHIGRFKIYFGKGRKV